MRVAPVGLRQYDNPSRLVATVRASSIPTHVHPLAIQGATWQAIAVAHALIDADAETQIRALQNATEQFRGLNWDTEPYEKALNAMTKGLEDNTSPLVVSKITGVGVAAHEAVPAAIYCELLNRDSYKRTLEEAIYLGGDTDTIACMAGAISGARHGASAIPSEWLDIVREPEFTPARIEQLAGELYTKTVE